MIQGVKTKLNPITHKGGGDITPQEPTLRSFEKLLRISPKAPGEIPRRNEVDSRRFRRESSVGEI